MLIYSHETEDTAEKDGAEGTIERWQPWKPQDCIHGQAMQVSGGSHDVGDALDDGEKLLLLRPPHSLAGAVIESPTEKPLGSS